jgi:hypothetical protein
MLALGFALIVTALVLAWYAVEDDHRRQQAAQVADQYEAAMAAGRDRHPSGRAA